MADEVAEEYDGPATLLVDGREVTVHTRLSGRFEPISGEYQWAGRLRPIDDGQAPPLRPGTGVRLRIGADGHPTDATIREQDPWGGFRVSGSGRPPFAVPSETV